ncbi:NHLP leader peptide family RiPP precursor [candidate division KSB1 bacterium]|nr:NHLP leader peptide family RiPP precursor [candidate division KSB1 bacterium]
MNKEILTGIMSKAVTDLEYRRRLVHSPRQVLMQEGFQVPVDKKVVILENTDDLLYIVLPPGPGKSSTVSDTFSWMIEENVIHLVGRLDAQAVDQIRDSILHMEGDLVLNLERLEYISSAGIGLLLLLFKNAQAAGSSVNIIHLQDRVRNILIMSGIGDLFQI